MIENQFNFNFASNKEPSLKAWEEENEEYASMNLIYNKQDTAPC